MTGKRIKKKLVRMSDAEPRFISLVDRSASQIPFRITKSLGKNTTKEQNMDLSSLKRIFKSEPAAVEPTIVAVVVGNGKNLENIKKALGEAGLKTDHVAHEDGTVSFSQVEKAEDLNGDIVKMSDNLLVVVKGFSSYANGQLKSFNDRLAIQNYYSGLTLGTDALRQAFYDAVDGAGTPEEAQVNISAVLEDFSSYVKGLVESLPEVCFTKPFQSVMKAADHVPVDEPGEKAPVAKSDDKTTEEKKEDTVTEETKVDPDKTPAAATPVVEATPKEPEAKEEVKKTAEVVVDPMVGLTASINALSELVKKSNESSAAAVAELKASTDKAVAGLTEELKSVAKKSEEFEKKVSGTVTAPPPEAETLPKEVAKKSDDEEDFPGGIIDTAMNPVRKSARRTR